MSSHYRIIPNRIGRLAHVLALCLRGTLLPGLLAVTVSVPALAGSVTYTYDTLGRLSTVTYSTGAVITYAYDAAGNRTSYVTTGAP